MGLAMEAVVVVRELARERVRVPVKEPVRILARELARGAIINAQHLVLSPARDVAAVRVAEIPVALDAQIAVRELAKVVVLLDAEALVAVAQDPVQQTARAIAAERAAVSASDRQRHQYIHFRRQYENDSY